MTPALSRLYCGPLEHLTPPFIGEVFPRDAIRGEALLDAPVLDALLARFATQYQGDDLKAIASLWSKWHFASVAAPALAANLLLERDLPLALDEMAIITNAEGRTTQLALPHEGRPLGSLDAFTRFEQLLQGHVAPLVQTLACVSGASPKVFWSNFGNYFEHFSRAAEQHPMALPGLADEALRLVDHRVYPDGRRNPLFMPVRYLVDDAGEHHRTRRLCCLRYRLPEFAYCGNCPLEGCAPRAAKTSAEPEAKTTTAKETKAKRANTRRTTANADGPQALDAGVARHETQREDRHEARSEARREALRDAPRQSAPQTPGTEGVAATSATVAG